MCMYSSEDGFANDWHLVHLGQFAIGGAGFVFTEATAVEPEGRISPDDLGIYHEEHLTNLSRITAFIKAHGAVPGIQLAHAGRKASMASGWKGGKLVPPGEGGWLPVLAPSAISFGEGYATPEALDQAGIDRLVKSFKTAAARSLEAGFEAIELHGAHGYLVNEFLSPFSNTRTDAYGGSFENRTRFLREVVSAVREVWPERLPLILRISATEWKEGGWSLEDSIRLAPIVRDLGVDLIDCSSGGNIPGIKIPVGPGYQTPLAAAVRKEGGVATGAVGLIVSGAQADHIVRTEQADLVFLAREMLRDPYFARRAAKELGQTITGPVQYARAW